MYFTSAIATAVLAYASIASATPMNNGRSPSPTAKAAPSATAIPSLSKTAQILLSDT
jgi:hypothetical protein